MARSRPPDSATCQFFINVKDNPDLDQPVSGGAGYAVFGQVVAGMDVVDAIKMVPTGQKRSRINVPIETVLIGRVERISPEEGQRRMAADGSASNGPGPD
jgi:peptidyl-prolyl cis-trans isomerase A (cyclophilin A)